MATGTKSRSRPAAQSGRTALRKFNSTLLAMVAGSLVLGAIGGYLVGAKRHTYQPTVPFEATISRVSLDHFSVCVTPKAGGADICDPLYRRADGAPPAVGEVGWFTYAYDTRGTTTYTLLVETRAG